jgi:hypothetical protein
MAFTSSSRRSNGFSRIRVSRPGSLTQQTSKRESAKCAQPRNAEKPAPAWGMQNMRRCAPLLGSGQTIHGLFLLTRSLPEAIMAQDVQSGCQKMRFEAGHSAALQFRESDPLHHKSSLLEEYWESAIEKGKLTRVNL